MRAAYVVLASLPGTFYTWQGDVLGRPNIDMPDALKKDGDIGGRDGERVPMQWDASYNGGFSDAPFEELWLPTVDANVYRGDNVAAQQQDATSPYRLLKKKLTLRRDDPALHNGELRMLHTENDAVLAFARSDPNNTRRQIISVVNFSPNTTTVYIPDVHMNRGRVLLSSTTGRGSNVTVDITRPIQLEPDTAYLIESLG